MIQKIRLLHYLSEATYKKICGKLNLALHYSAIGDNYVAFPDKPISRAQLFNIVYQQFGHIWFMYIEIDFPRFQCTYEAFAIKLYERYNELFGADIMSDFPPYDGLNCDYIEYSNSIDVTDAKTAMSRLAADGCTPEQLDKTKWDQYKKHHGTIEFCLSAIDDTHLETLARCHGLALKKRVTDTKYHRATGLTPVIAVNIETENDIIYWLRKKYQV